jgi:hypothetical protein
VLKTALSRLTMKGAMADELEKNLVALEKEVSEQEVKDARKRTEDEALDARVLADAKARATPLAQQYRFGEARVALAAATVKSEKGKREKDTLMKRAEWLGQFKSQLIRDLSTVGYSAPIARKTGGQVPGTVSRATEAQLEIMTPHGILAFPWTDVASDSIFQMARSFIRPDSAPERIADRQWLLGVYALFAGKHAEGRALLAESSQTKSEYRDQVARFLESPE